MAYCLGVEIRDEALHFIYGRVRFRKFCILDQGVLPLETDIICNGIIEKEDVLGALLIKYLEQKKWYPNETSILIPSKCVIRREIYMPKFMENHIKAYLATYPERWVDENLQDYVFTAHRLARVNEHIEDSKIVHEQIMYEQTAHKQIAHNQIEHMGIGSRRKRQVKQVAISRYCLVGSMKEAIMRPYHLFRKLKCSPNFISTPLDVALYGIENFKEEQHEMVLLEREGEWCVGIYERGVCMFTINLSKGDAVKTLLELRRLMEFYAMKSSQVRIKGCTILWQHTYDEAFETLIEENFDLEVKSLNDTTLLNGLKKSLEQTSFIRRAL